MHAFAHRIRRSPRHLRALVLLFALASTWLQFAWHAPMALAGSSPALANVTCGGPLDAGDIARLVALGQLPADEAEPGHSLCDLLTSPVADTVSPPAAPPAAVAAVAPPSAARATLVAVSPASLPPARAPPSA